MGVTPKLLTLPSGPLVSSLSFTLCIPTTTARPFTSQAA